MLDTLHDPDASHCDHGISVMALPVENLWIVLTVPMDIAGLTSAHPNLTTERR